MIVTSGVIAAGVPINLDVYATPPGQDAPVGVGNVGVGRVVRVSLSKREREIDSEFTVTGGTSGTYDASVAGHVRFTVPPISGVDGVLRITAADAVSGTPLAERCVPHGFGRVASRTGFGRVAYCMVLGVPLMRGVAAV